MINDKSYKKGLILGKRKLPAMAYVPLKVKLFKVSNDGIIQPETFIEDPPIIFDFSKY
jgi:hypothetical protein